MRKKKFSINKNIILFIICSFLSINSGYASPNISINGATSLYKKPPSMSNTLPNLQALLNTLLTT